MIRTRRSCSHGLQTPPEKPHSERHMLLESGSRAFMHILHADRLIRLGKSCLHAITMNAHLVITWAVASLVTHLKHFNKQSAHGAAEAARILTITASSIHIIFLHTYSSHRLWQSTASKLCMHSHLNTVRLVGEILSRAMLH